MLTGPENQKPPLGIMPQRIHKEIRVTEIARAISDYARHGKFIPPEWTEELSALAEWLRDHPAPAQPERDESVVDSAGAAKQEVAGLGGATGSICAAAAGEDFGPIEIEIRSTVFGRRGKSLVQGIIARELVRWGFKVMCGEKWHHVTPASRAMVNVIGAPGADSKIDADTVSLQPMKISILTSRGTL